jgi:hypothetical protein
MKISPYTIYLEMQPDALLVRQNFIICKKWVLQVGKQKMDPEEKEEEMKFHKAKRDLKAVYGHSESSDNERRKMLHIMFRGSWDITSRRVIKTLHREVVAVAPTPRAAPHCKWLETATSFDATNCPKSMAGTRQLSLVVSPTIANFKLYHVLINGGAALNLISLTVFKKLQILMLRL